MFQTVGNPCFVLFVCSRQGVEIEHRNMANMDHGGPWARIRFKNCMSKRTSSDGVDVRLFVLRGIWVGSGRIRNASFVRPTEEFVKSGSKRRCQCLANVGQVLRVVHQQRDGESPNSDGGPPSHNLFPEDLVLWTAGFSCFPCYTSGPCSALQINQASKTGSTHVPRRGT